MSCKHNKIIACDTNNSDCSTCAVGMAVQSFTEELEKFKEIGLTPDQLREVDRLYTEKCRELAELEKKYQVVVNNNGWIPCSSGKMPEEFEDVEVTIEEDADEVGGKRYYNVRSWLQDGQWVIKKNPYHPTVIAWKYPTEPYNPKGEREV